MRGRIVDESVSAILRSAGRRVTQQRLLVLETIQQGGGHLDAEEIFDLARRKTPTLSLSTVYRTINVLKEAGVVEELHLGEDHHHYELKSQEGHHHLICQSCGKVVEFDCPFSQPFLHDLGEEREFQITGVQLNLTGYCSDCRQG